MEYLVSGRKYSVSYAELRLEYERHCAMTDEEFMKNLPSAAHLACIICWLKGVDPDRSIGDRGIVHEIVHLMHVPGDPAISEDFPRIRRDFRRILKLSR